MLHFFVTVLDQPLPDRMLFGGMRVLLCAWILGFVVVNNVYKSFMISSLAAPGSLRLPATLGELSTWDKYPIQSVTFTRMFGADVEQTSILKDFIIPHILRLAGNGSQKFRMFETFQARVKYCDSRVTNIVQFANSTFTRSPVLLSSGEWLTVGGVFAAIDKDETLWKLESILNFFGAGYTPIRNRDADFYTTHYAWLIDPNFFGALFSVQLARIVESGIFCHFQNLEKIGARLNIDANLMNGKRVKFDVNFQKIIFGIRSDSAGGEDETMDLTKLRVPFALVLVLLLVGLVIFTGEVVPELLKGSKNKVLRLCTKVRM